MTVRICQPRWMRVFAPLVGLAFFQIVIITLPVSPPELQEFFHPDSHKSGLHCLADDFQSGFIEQPVVVPIHVPSYAPVIVGLAAFPASGWQSLPRHLFGSLLEQGAAYVLPERQAVIRRASIPPCTLRTLNSFLSGNIMQFAGIIS